MQLAGFPLRLAVLAVLLPVLLPPAGFADDAAFDTMAAAIKRLDERMPGNFGVYIKRLQDGREVSHHSNRTWYLASTIKIPLAIAVLQQVEAGQLSLDQELELTEQNYVDGAGELQFAEPGSRYTVEELIQRSTEHSDSTATDMLIRLLGEEAFNRQLKERIASTGFEPITTILQVRHDAYSEVHSSARQLTNLDFIELKEASAYSERYERLLRKLDLTPADAGVENLEAAFERYYARGLNSGSLAAMGKLLEQLVRQQLLSAANTDRLLEYMENVNTGDARIKAGLPAGTSFAHKTGTQIDRACNVGIVNPRVLENAVVVVACAEGYGDIGAAEHAFAELGRLLSSSGLVR